MDIKAKREEVREEIAFKLFEHYYLDVFQQVVSGFSWRNDYGWAKAKYYRRADEIISDLDSLGVMLVDREAELPKLPEALTVEYVIYDDMDDTEVFYDEEALDKAGYVKAYPLEEIGGEK